MQNQQAEKRKLGNSGLEVAPLIFGGNVFGWTVKEEAASEFPLRFLWPGCWPSLQ